jgi:hypothetical protein
MSRSSVKQRVTQLMEWMPTLKSKRNKPVKSNVSGKPRTQYDNVKIKNM